jgi:hypothetical protein
MPGTAPLRPTRSTAAAGAMPSVREEQPRDGAAAHSPDHDAETDYQDFDPSVAGSAPEFGNEYREDLVDVLDTIGRHRSKG